MFNCKRFLAALIGVLTLYVVEARADSFVITNLGGFLAINTSRDGGPPTLRLTPTFTLSGSGLTVSTRGTLFSGGDVGNVEARDTCLNTFCGPGTPLTTNSTFSGIIGAPGDVVATVNGVTFTNVTLTGSLSFVSSAIVLPDFGAGVGQVTIPFFMSGELDGALAGAGTPIFTTTLSGHGLATFIFFETSRDPSNPHYVIANIEYQFDPVPEPATLILLSSGVTGLAAFARRRHNRERQ